MIKVAINGFGRIGRQAFKVWFEKFRDDPSTGHSTLRDKPSGSDSKSSGSDGVEIVAINDIVSASTLAHLLKYDSVYGVWNQPVSGKDFVQDVKNVPDGQPVGEIKIGGLAIPTFATREPAKLPWKELKVDVVCESTGRFTKQEQAAVHIRAGAKKVVVSAPSKDTLTLLLGVNKYDGKAVIVNNASCTTNCIAPVAKVINEAFGIKKAVMTTVHAVTAEQNLVDGPPPGGKAGDLRRARAAYTNIIPTTTGAAMATCEVIPKLRGKFDGVALRVPVICGSIADFTFLVNKKVTVGQVNAVLVVATVKDSPLHGILAVSEEPLVSSDIIGRSESAIVDLLLTQVVDGDMVKVFAWYDNEFGYANRLIEQVIQVGKSISS